MADRATLLERLSKHYSETHDTGTDQSVHAPSSGPVAENANKGKGNSKGSSGELDKVANLWAEGRSVWPNNEYTDIDVSTDDYQFAAQIDSAGNWEVWGHGVGVVDGSWSGTGGEEAAIAQLEQALLDPGEVYVPEVPGDNRTGGEVFRDRLRSGSHEADLEAEFGEMPDSWNTWWNDLDDNQFRVIDDYVTDSREYNDLLRSGSFSIEEWNNTGLAAGAGEGNAMGMAAFDASMIPLEQEMTLYRGVRPGRYLQMTESSSHEETVGSIFADLGFISTSVDRDAARAFGTTILRIKTPVGTRVAPILFTAEGLGNELEVVLDNGSAFKVTGVEDAGETTFVDVELLSSSGIHKADTQSPSTSSRREPITLDLQEFVRRLTEDIELVPVENITKRNINRTPDYPHGRSIKWPKVYRGLRRRGMSKEKAARISNAMSNKYRGGSRQPLSRRAGKKPIPEDILDKRPDLRKGQPDGGDLHVNQPLGRKKRKDEEDEKKRKRKSKKLLVGKRYILDDRFIKHYAPTHDTGTGQEVHGTGGGGGSDSGGDSKGDGGDDATAQPDASASPPSDPDSPGPADESLRPTRMSDFIGQENLKSQLNIMMESAKNRGAQLDHMLFSGPPGLGKTTMARIMAEEMGANLEVVTGPVLRSPSDLMGKLAGLQDGDFLFIDEIHALPRNVQEILYPAMEDFEADLRLGDDTVRVELPQFTLLGATTRAGDLERPLVDRFGMVGEMEYYKPTDLSTLVNKSAEKLGMQLDPDAAMALAERSRGTPRVANNLLEWTRDYSSAREGGGTVTRSTVDSALTMARIDHAGLSPDHRDYLSAVREMGTSGVNTIAARMGTDEVNLTDAIEPYLIREGFVTRTPRGRVITDKGINHLDTLDEAFTKRYPYPRLILKHGTHDQSTHGNWARGTSARQIKDKTLESGEPKSGERGSSTYIPTGEEPDTGFVVGTSSRSKHFTSQPSVSSIRKYIADNRDLLVKPDYALGTWEAKDGSWWLDTTRVFDTAEEAWEYGPNEEAIFDLDTYSTIYNPSQGD